MVLHTIGSASDSGGSASANSRRGARVTDAWHRPRAAAGGLRDWYAICVESGVCGRSAHCPNDKMRRLTLSSFLSALAVLAICADPGNIRKPPVILPPTWWARRTLDRVPGELPASMSRVFRSHHRRAASLRSFAFSAILWRGRFRSTAARHSGGHVAVVDTDQTCPSGPTMSIVADGARAGHIAVVSRRFQSWRRKPPGIRE